MASREPRKEHDKLATWQQLNSEQEVHDAGEFAAWLEDIRRAVRDRREASVPCGSCTACCQSRFFIHIEPDELETLRHIPKGLTFSAPGLPAGHKVLGYDQQGRCPMFKNRACSIYLNRPRTCRIFDCRVLPASGLGVDQPLIDERAKLWRFRYRDQAAKDQHMAVQKAAQFLNDNKSLFPFALPSHPAQLALIAIKVYAVFLDPTAEQKEPRELVSDILRVHAAFEQA